MSATPSNSSTQEIDEAAGGKKQYVWFIIYDAECNPAGAVRAKTKKGAEKKFAEEVEMDPGGFHAERLSTENGNVTVFETYHGL